MSTIIAGMFENIFQAEVAAESLRRHHFAGGDVCHFVCNPTYAPGGAGAGAGAGSQSGALDGKGIESRHVKRRAGVMVAARADGVADEQTAIQVLQAEGASHIEKAEGTWSGGNWTDFDPVVEPRLVQVDPMTLTVAGYRVGDKVLVGQAHQMGRAGAKGGRSPA